MRTAAPSDPAAASAGDRGPGAEADGKILGAPRIAERFAGLTKEVPGLSSGQVQVRAAGPFAGGRVVPADKKPGPQ
ncbi:hypothetical protein AB0K47_12940 [Streptomyces tirandamycinicus]|uniref:hypothetical protein n=1 Tax=Streptomyces tirandamycinicus TaxID=2174846 RepID=UPI00344A98A2